MRTLLIIVLVIVLLIVFNTVYIYADDDTYVKIQEMINDLGGPQYQTQNNGKVQKCADSGTKQITIKKVKGSTSYKGVYKKCREYGRFRDGHLEITIGN